ncbi:MAG TPA: hypothetical protein PK776_03855 [Flavobacterium sp.]|nr:hypothetical protein [Flavobacterium sp.]
MKYYLIILLTGVFVHNNFFQEKYLEGKYSILFEEKYNNQNGIIHFNKKSYERKLLNEKKVSGIIDNQKFRIVLKDKDTPYEIIIVKSSLSNDTIPFRTIDVRDKTEQTGDIVIHEGKLIKIK